MPAKTDFEYRICWSASSNISFNGATDREPWDGLEESEEAIQDVFNAGEQGPTSVPVGLGMALDACGFEWWGEVRAA